MADGAVGHEFLKTLTEAGSGTPLSEPAAMAIDHATGEIFVGDAGAGNIDVYGAGGAFETQFGSELEVGGLAVDEATGDVYVAEPYGEVVLAYRPDPAGGYQLLAEWSGAATPGRAFGEVSGVAFDNSTSTADPSAGDLYVLESEAVGEGGGAGAGAVDVFRPKPNPSGSDESEGEEGSFVRRLGGPKEPKLEEPNAIAIDGTTGRVLVGDSVQGAIYAYSDEGAFQEKLTGSGQPFGSFTGREDEEENIAALGVEESSGDIYVAETEHRAIGQYSEAGEWLGWTVTSGAGAGLVAPRGVAVGAEGNLYVADPGAGALDIYGPGLTVPDAETGRAGKLARTSAVLVGTIDGDGTVAHYWFEWGESEALGQHTPLQTTAGGGEDKVALPLEGLRAGRSYYFRVVAENEGLLNYGVIHEFTTAPAVEALSTGMVRELASTSATVTGTLTPGGADTRYVFEWGTGTGYGSATAIVDAGAGQDAVSAEATLTKLKPNSTYHYRLVGENEYGVTYGADQSFTTSGPPRLAVEPVDGIGHAEATLHAKIDPDELETSYRFEYGETTGYGSDAPAGGAKLAGGEVYAAVAVGLTGLKIGTTYHYRLVAENSAGTAFGPDEVFETIPPAPIDATYSSEVGSSEATLHTEIDPSGRATSYHFQYGTDECAQDSVSCTDSPAPAPEVGAGETDVAEELHLQGLVPGTTYHYRVLDENSLGSTEGVERTFTTKAAQGSFALADGRSWELVTPTNKHGAAVEPLTREGGLIRAAEDGSRLAYVTNGSVVGEPQGNRSPEMEQALATRSEDGWTSEAIVTPQVKPHGVSLGDAPEYQFFSPDLSSALVQPWAATTNSEPPLAPEATQSTIYVRDDRTGSYLPLVTEANVTPGTVFGAKLHFRNATPDLSHVVFSSEVPLAPAPAAAGLYEWSAGTLQFVSLLSSGLAAREPELGYYNVVANTVSTDGSRVIWTVPSEAQEAKRGHLYMRDTSTGQTLQLDAAQGVAEPEHASAQFQTASADGSKVFFTDKQRLLPDASAEPAQGLGKPDLYECEVVEEEDHNLRCELHDLTVGENEDEPADVQYLLLGASESGNVVYAIAQGLLAGNENGNHEQAQSGQDNLYEIMPEGKRVGRRFIATLAIADAPEWEGNDHKSDTAFMTARVSPDGRYLSFMSSAPITGYENTDQNTGQRDEEVYLYDSDTDSLTCVSCNPTGERPTGVADVEETEEGLGLLVDRREIWLGHTLAGDIPGWTAQSIQSALYQSRYLSDEGRLFFDSPDDLVPAATNDKNDVYEYEPTGVGTCDSATGGCIALLSSGTAERESAFLEATPSGNDVYFLTEAQLLPQDTDTAFDIYDARVCTTTCLATPSAVEGGCSSTDACRPAPAPQQPGGEPAGTMTFTGPGNPTEPTVKQESRAFKTVTKPRSKTLTRAQRLANALSQCKRRYPHSKHRRHACEARARKRYAPAKHRRHTRTSKIHKGTRGRRRR